MPRGDKVKYTDKQKRQAEHIEDSYRDKGVPQDEAEARAWATVNKMTPVGARYASKQGACQKRRQGRRSGLGSAHRSRTQCFGQEGCTNARPQCRGYEAVML